MRGDGWHTQDQCGDEVRQSQVSGYQHQDSEETEFFETAIRGELKEYVQRGKVDVFIAYEDTAESNLCVKYNRELAAEYMKYLWQMSEDFSLDNDVRVSTLSRYRKC